MTLAALDTAAVSSARGRNGEPREDRPEEAETALNVEEARVGFQNGTPLLEREYGEYQTGKEILRPEAGDALEAVAAHDMVGTVADIGHELNATPSTVETALELHEVEPPTDADPSTVVAEDQISVPLDGTVNTDHLRTPVYEDARLLEYLYVRCGYGVGEIREYLQEQMNRGRDPEKASWSVREAEVRDALEAVGLLERDSNPESRDDLRLGGTTVSMDESERSSSGGLNVSTSDF
jgi:hypothetical protein